MTGLLTHLSLVRLPVLCLNTVALNNRNRGLQLQEQFLIFTRFPFSFVFTRNQYSWQMYNIFVLEEPDEHKIMCREGLMADSSIKYDTTMISVDKVKTLP